MEKATTVHVDVTTHLAPAGEWYAEELAWKGPDPRSPGGAAEAMRAGHDQARQKAAGEDGCPCPADAHRPHCIALRPEAWDASLVHHWVTTNEPPAVFTAPAAPERPEDRRPEVYGEHARTVWLSYADAAEAAERMQRARSNREPGTKAESHRYKHNFYVGRGDRPAWATDVR